jgi:hypothetical protein
MYLEIHVNAWAYEQSFTVCLVRELAKCILAMSKGGGGFGVLLDRTCHPGIPREITLHNRPLLPAIHWAPAAASKRRTQHGPMPSKESRRC